MLSYIVTIFFRWTASGNKEGLLPEQAAQSSQGFSFELQKTCPVTGARAGLLRTTHSVIETPVFMPVGTQGTVKTMS